MARSEGEQTLMRIFVGESDRWQHQPLYEAIVELLRGEGLAGATVLKGAMGFGAGSVTHSDRLLRFSSDLPVVVEAVDEHEKIQGVLEKLDRMMSGGMITLERARVIRYCQEEK